MLCLPEGFNHCLPKESGFSKIKQTIFAVQRFSTAMVLLLIFAATESVTAREGVKRSEQVRDRINSVWDEGLKRIWLRQIEAGCKADAKKQYSAIRFNKRRAFVDQCITKATASGSSQTMHRPN
jgi:hypothetical protein